MIREAAFEVFRHEAGRVWRNAGFALPRVQLSHEEPTTGVLASLAYSGRVCSVGESILQCAAQYTLRVSDRLLERDAGTVRRVMAHEAIHLGVVNHGQEFRAHARRVDATISEEGLETPGVQAQKKVGARYQTVRIFDDEREATTWVKEQLRAEPGSRWRLSMGGW